MNESRWRWGGQRLLVDNVNTSWKVIFTGNTAKSTAMTSDDAVVRVGTFIIYCKMKDKRDIQYIIKRVLTSPLPDGWTDRPQETIGRLLWTAWRASASCGESINKHNQGAAMNNLTHQDWFINKAQSKVSSIRWEKMTDHAGEGHEESSWGSLAVLLSWLMGPQPTGEFQRAAEVRGHVVVSGVKDESDRLHKHRDYE